MDVVAVERRDERLVQGLDAGVRDDVGLVLDLLDAGGQRADVLAALHQPLHLLRALDRQRGVALEEAEEVVFAGKQPTQHRAALSVRLPLKAS